MTSPGLLAARAPRVVLASASPTRAHLLRAAGVPFEQQPAAISLVDVLGGTPGSLEELVARLGMCEAAWEELVCVSSMAVVGGRAPNSVVMDGRTRGTGAF